MNNNRPQIELGVLDTGILIPGANPRTTLNESLVAAQKLENAGYSRYWLSEHHEAHYSWTCPSIVIAYLAAQTTRIRFGTAAIMLGLRPPLKAAEDYRALENMFPGRIDYGICSASPSCDTTRQALMDGSQKSMQDVSSSFENKIVEFHSYLHNEYSEGHRFIYGATPVIKKGNATWVMGSGMGSATLAAKYGTAYSYSLFHRRSQRNPEALALYQSNFTPSFGYGQTNSNIAISVIVGESEEEAQEQKKWVESMQSDFCVNVCGNIDNCVEQIESLCTSYKTNEVIIYMMWHVFEKRIKGFEMLAEAFALRIE